jgi:hypothetical protein
MSSTLFYHGVYPELIKEAVLDCANSRSPFPCWTFGERFSTNTRASICVNFDPEFQNDFRIE